MKQRKARIKAQNKIVFVRVEEECMNNGVVIVTYNRLELLKECIDCVCKQSIPFSHIIIVNNCSTDGTKEYLDTLKEEVVNQGYKGQDSEDKSSEDKSSEDQNFEDQNFEGQVSAFHMLHQEENLGGAGGFYEGLAFANTLDLDWVLIIDDDAMISQNYMECLLEARKKGIRSIEEQTLGSMDAKSFSKNENIEGECGSKGIYALAGSVWTNGQIDLSHRRRITNRILFSESFVPLEDYEKDSLSRENHVTNQTAIRVENQKVAEKKEYPTCDCATFCGLVISGQKMKEIGLPKKEYFLWYDDTEYCMRLMKSGGITLVPEAKLHHKTKLSQEGMVVKGVLERIGWRQYYGYRNRLDTAKIHLGGLTVFAIGMEYHALSMMSRVMGLLPGKKEKGRANVAIIQDALRDGKAGNLGKNNKYHP